MDPAPFAGRGQRDTPQREVDRQEPTDLNEASGLPGPAARGSFALSRGTSCEPSLIIETMTGGGATGRTLIEFILAWVIWMTSWLIAIRETNDGKQRGLLGSTPQSPSVGARGDETDGVIRGEVAPEGGSVLAFSDLPLQPVVATVMHTGDVLSSTTEPPSHHETRDTRCPWTFSSAP